MNNILKCGIIPFTYFGGVGKPVGSTFLRVDNLVRQAEDFEVWQHGHSYHSLIFQKAYWPEMARLFKGPKILDICDPDWISDEFSLIELGSQMDAITCSSENLTNLTKQYFSQKIVVHVPDRLDFNIFPSPRPEHSGPIKTAVWFGFIQNAYEVLPPLGPLLAQSNIKLTIIADRPYEQDDIIKEMGHIFYTYNQQDLYNIIKQSDTVVNPKSGKARFKYKSNNKSIISWMLGVPVAETIEELENLMVCSVRNAQVLKQRQIVKEYYNISQSAEQYRAIIKQVCDRKF